MREQIPQSQEGQNLVGDTRDWRILGLIRGNDEPSRGMGGGQILVGVTGEQDNLVLRSDDLSRSVGVTGNRGILVVTVSFRRQAATKEIPVLLYEYFYIKGERCFTYVALRLALE